jgi:hypothetical protein
MASTTVAAGAGALPLHCACIYANDASLQALEIVDGCCKHTLLAFP